MHRIAMWITVAISAAGIFLAYLGYTGDENKNPAVPTDNEPAATSPAPVP